MSNTVNFRRAILGFGNGKVLASRSPGKAQYYLRVKDELDCSVLLLCL